MTNFCGKKECEKRRTRKMSEKMKGGKEKKITLDQMIEDALKKAPKIEGYTVKQLAEITGSAVADRTLALRAA